MINLLERGVAGLEFELATSESAVKGGDHWAFDPGNLIL